MINGKSLDLFHKVAKEIPAYREFLKKQGINPAKIQTKEDFSKIPLTCKKNYLVNNNLENLVWKKDLDSLLLFCATSGSTGKPYYFPRSETSSVQYSHIIENYLNNSSYKKGSTLVLIGFGMGVWIGGIITLRAFEIAAFRTNSKISILPVGYNKKELVKALKDLSPNFEQTIIVGYPPFIKEIVDEAVSLEIDLSKIHCRFLFAAEAFTETFRTYVCEKSGIKNPILDTMNIYGSADIGAMAYETPLSILIRRLIIEDSAVSMEVFGQIEKTPTLAQFDSKVIEFEEVNGEIVLTGDAALPLIRYAIGDRGGVITYNDMVKRLKHLSIDIAEEIKKADINNTVQNYPFVYVYERTDFAATLHGIVIYPEFVKEGLLNKEVIQYFTGRFTMSTKNDILYNQFLKINVELHEGVIAKDSLIRLAKKVIKKSLATKSSEFSEISKSESSSSLIQIVLWSNGHKKYFAPGTKQKWVEKL